MKRKVFLRTFILTVVSAVLIFTSGVLAINKNSKTVVKERLAAEAEILCDMIKSEEDIDKLSAFNGRDDFRITVIKENGEVLYESNSGGEFENHADRKEFVSALNGTPTTVERYSSTLHCKMTYYAVKTTFDSGDTAVIRIAVKSGSISAFLGVSVPALVLVLALSVIMSAFFSDRLSSDVSEKFREVTDSLRSLNEGTYRPIATDSGEPELYAVLVEINELNEKTHTYIRSQKNEKEKLAAVLSGISQGVIATDKNMRTVFANMSALKMFGSDSCGISENLIFMIDDKTLCDRICELSESGGIFTYTYEDKDLSVAVKRVEDKVLSEEISTIIVITDITKENIIAKEKSDFFANASHELKTPITVIQGNSELLLAKNNLPPPEKKQIERIHTEALRMSGLISDMLKLSGLELQKSETCGISLSLRHTVDEAVSELSSEIEKKNLSTEVSGDCTVTADPKKMYELVSNLLSNAVNYNKPDGRITVSLFEEGGHSVLRVSDTGIGIPKEHLPRICERFYRVDKSRSKKTGGTGLGLAIVKHICAIYGATLDISGKEDEGTTVTVRFPQLK